MVITGPLYINIKKGNAARQQNFKIKSHKRERGVLKLLKEVLIFLSQDVIKKR